MVKAKQPPGPPMTLGNMRELGVRGLLVSCLNHACQHSALIDVSSYPSDVEVPSFGRRMKCSKCGGGNVDVRPNWKEQPPSRASNSPIFECKRQPSTRWSSTFQGTEPSRRRYLQWNPGLASGGPRPISQEMQIVRQHVADVPSSNQVDQINRLHEEPAGVISGVNSGYG
jgi:hypothetical protein